MKTALVLSLLVLVPIQNCLAQKIDVYSRPQQNERSRDYDAIHYRVGLTFDEETKSFWGENRITLSPLNDGFDTCALDAETFRVTSVVGEDSSSLDFGQHDGKLTVRFPRPYNYSDTLSFTVSYAGENVDVNAEEFGMSKNYDLGLDFKAETPENPQLINTLSFPEGARHWFPCYDHPNDKATSEVIATVRADYKVLSNGRLVSVTEDLDLKTKTFHWSQERPHPTYLFVLVAGPYEVIADSLGSLPINYWVYKKDVEDARRSFHKTPEIIEFFNREYGFDYPWVKYDQITIPGIGGGAESTNATVLGQSTIHDERADQDFSSHWLVAHEAAHQWWGDLVTMRDWSHAWINESFATYGEYLFSRYDLGEDEGAVNLLRKKNAYLREASTRYIRPIVFDRWEYPNQMFDSHLYPKGAVVLNMMRFVLGDGPFQRAMSRFLHEHAFKSVDSHDLLKTIKDVTGVNLDWFFEQWLFSPGHPIFEITYTWDETTGILRLSVVQTQKDKRVPIFRMPVQIGIVTEDGQQTETVWLVKKAQTFEFQLSDKPLLVRFDEGNYLLKEWTFKKSVDELLYQLHHDDVIGRAWAATELSAHKDNNRAEAALQEAATADSFWFVRQKAIEALSDFKKDSHVSFFKERSLDDKSAVRAAALKALGDFEKAELVPFFRERFVADDSYVVQAEALRSIGKCGGQNDVGFLEGATRIRSPRNVLRRAAEWALVQIGK